MQRGYYTRTRGGKELSVKLFCVHVFKLFVRKLFANIWKHQDTKQIIEYILGFKRFTHEIKNAILKKSYNDSTYFNCIYSLEFFFFLHKVNIVSTNSRLVTSPLWHIIHAPNMHVPCIIQKQTSFFIHFSNHFQQSTVMHFPKHITST